MKAMHFAHTFREPCEQLLTQGSKMHEFLSNIKKNETFKKWLEYILAFGNYMNGQGFYGGAYGFKMDAIKKITEVKSTDDSKTLLEFMIEDIGKNEKNKPMLDFYVELQDLQEGKISIKF